MRAEHLSAIFHDMDGSGEPSAKRLKTAKTDRLEFFKKFSEHRTNLGLLKRAYGVLRSGTDHVFLRVLKLKGTNACLDEAFSRASCKDETYKNDGQFLIYAVGSIFTEGVTVLRNFLGKNPLLPKDERKQEALFKLLKFIEDQELSIAALLDCDKCDETQWAVRVAQHLLLPLSVAENYLIDESYDGLKKCLGKCPCNAADNISGYAGDTSFGLADGWHGKTDIIVNSVAVDLANPSVVEDEELKMGSSALSESMSSTEIKVSSNFIDRDLQQIKAQTIVFSFLQHKENDGNYKYSLVPGIGISKKKFVSYFYDCNDDVFLGSEQIDLFGVDSFNCGAIVFLWLTLNYKIFCSGITNSMKNFKAEFFNGVGRFLEHYKNDVARGISKKVERSDKTGNIYAPIAEEVVDKVNAEDEWFLMFPI